MKTTFRTTILKDAEKNATGIQFPAEVVASLGAGKKPPVKVTIHNYTYRTTVASYGDVLMMSLSAENRNAAGVQAGHEVEVTVELDQEPRTVEVPSDLAEAMAQHEGMREAFDALSYSIRKEHVRQVESAKSPDTRQRRLEKIIASLTDK